MESQKGVSEQLVKLAYAEFAGHYSKRHWFSNEALWNQLSEADREFWKEFVQGIRTGFKSDPVKQTFSENK